MKNLVAILITMLFAGCKGCKDSPAPIPTPIEVINATAKPVEDALRAENKALKDSISSLTKKLSVASAKTQIVKDKGTKTIAARQEAKIQLDTVLVNELCDELEYDYRGFVEATEYEDSIQSAIIVKQDSVITTQGNQLEVANKKQTKTEEAFNQEAAEHNLTKKQLKKKNRQLKGSKFFNKVTVVAAAAAAAIIIFK